MAKPAFLHGELAQIVQQYRVAQKKFARGMQVQYPLSRDEHAAMTRYLLGIRKQLQDVSDLFTARYGKNSSIAEIAVKTLVSTTLLEHELMLLEGDSELALEADLENIRPRGY